MNPRPNVWFTGLLLTLPGAVWLALLHQLEGYPGGTPIWLRGALVAVPLGLVATGFAVWLGRHLSAGPRSDGARVVIWAVTLAVAVAGALAGAGAATAALFGGHPATVGRDGVAAFLLLFPLALLTVSVRRLRLARAADPVRRPTPAGRHVTHRG